MNTKRLIVVTGLSGSGKSVVLNALEDLGYYCIDNLPINLLSEFLLQIQNDQGMTYQKVAVGIDARNPEEDLSRFPEMLEQLSHSDFEFEQVYVEASNDVLIKRYSETRRRHPLSNESRTLAEAIRYERELLEPLLENSCLRIDTSHTHIHTLRDLVRERIARRAANTLSIQILSFGFKYGIPPDADFLFDVRCLPNPYWEAHLRDFTGRDQEVIDFLENEPAATEMLGELKQFLDAWIPRYESDDRSYLTIGIGCTGGHHRSVYMVEKLTTYFRNNRKDVLATHRDL